MNCPYCDKPLTVKAKFIDDDKIEVEVECPTDGNGKDCFPETWTYLKLKMVDSNWALTNNG